MDNQNIINQEPQQKKKRGRKPKNPQDKIYFGETEEKAVIDYLNAKTSAEKNLIFIKILNPAFKKMIESLIRGMDLDVPDEDFQTTFDDCLNNLLWKFDKFNPSKGTKAFSYYGTLCKNYLKQRIKDYNRTQVRNPSYDMVGFDVTNDLRYTNSDDKGQRFAQEKINALIEKINKMVETPSEYDLKASEISMGKALVKLFEEWDDVLSFDKSSNFNKKAIYHFLKQETKLTTKGLRDNIKKYKKEFLIVSDAIINY